MSKVKHQEGHGEDTQEALEPEEEPSVVQVQEVDLEEEATAKKKNSERNARRLHTKRSLL